MVAARREARIRENPYFGFLPMARVQLPHTLVVVTLEPQERWSTAKLLLTAEHAVDLGGNVLRRGRSHIGALIAKGDRDFATDVDVQIERTVRESLAGSTPEIPFLGEEEGGGKLDRGARWVLDPIDGTINFSKDSPLCAISLSLVVDGQPVLGIVDTPFLGERFVARQGDGAYLNGTRIAVAAMDDLHEAVVGLADFKVGVGSEEENRVHLALLASFAHRCLRVRMHGSAALDLAWLAAGRLHATAMLSNLPWDVTAGLLLVREAGGTVYDFDGSAHDADSRFTIASATSLVEPLGKIVREAM
jgi:myo-inositol-1(or 4)-monophosphatase